MGQRQVHQKILDMSRLRHRRLKKFSSCRHIVEKLMYKESRPVGGAGLLQGYFFSALDHISCPEFAVFGLCDQFCARYRRNA